MQAEVFSVTNALYEVGRMAGARLSNAVLDSLPDATAVVDETSRIISVNYTWRMFAVDNGGRPETTGVGVDYLAVCSRAADAGCPDAGNVADGLRAVSRQGWTILDRNAFPMALHARQVQQHGKSCCAFNQRADRRTAEAKNKVSLPMTGPNDRGRPCPRLLQVDR